MMLYAAGFLTLLAAGPHILVLVPVRGMGEVYLAYVIVVVIGATIPLVWLLVKFGILGRR